MKNICIIDNDKIYTFGVSKIIKNQLPRNKIISFENGRNALDAIHEMLQNNDPLPDLILLDIKMPELNGWDFLHEFKKIRGKIDKEIQIFVISSRISKTNRERYRLEWEPIVTDFIPKPVKMGTLQALIN